MSNLDLVMATDFTLIVPSGLLLLLLAVTFYKVWYGTGFRFVLVLIALLFAANFGFITVGIG